MHPKAIARLRLAATVALTIYSAGYVAWMAAHHERYQWDFKIYYYAARAWMAGESPYDLQALNRAGGGDIWLPFVYLPTSVLLFVPFALLPYTVAWYLWLVLLLGCLGLLVRLWWGLLPGVDRVLIWGALLFGFGGALIWAVRSANVELMAQLLLWTGLVLLLRERYAVFALLTALTGIWKIDRLALLGLLALIPGDRRQRLSAAGVGLAVFVAVGLLPLGVRPDLARGWWGHLSQLRETGKTTPCALALIDDVYDVALRAHAVPAAAREVAWGVYCLALVAISWRAVARARVSGDRWQLLMMGVILFTLLAPRMKVYSYVMLVVPTLVLYLPVMARLRAEALYLALVALPGVLMQPEALTRVYHHYYPFLVNLLMWLGYVLLGGQEKGTQRAGD